jgi:hypothetical protein
MPRSLGEGNGMKSQFLRTAAILMLMICVVSLKAQLCKVYFVIAEQDYETSNLNMAGFNKPQEKWWSKNAKKTPEICYLNANPKGGQAPLESLNDSFVNSDKNLPIYAITWGESKYFVPDNNGGHNAYDARGVLSLWTPAADSGKGNFVTIAPVHNTNKTILSSSSISMLKEALSEIKKRIQ